MQAKVYIASRACMHMRDGRGRLRWKCMKMFVKTFSIWIILVPHFGSLFYAHFVTQLLSNEKPNSDAFVWHLFIDILKGE